MATGGDFRGHQRVPQMAISGDFLVATDNQVIAPLETVHCEALTAPRPQPAKLRTESEAFSAAELSTSCAKAWIDRTTTWRGGGSCDLLS